MSINIQTAAGLLAIGGSVTKEKITSALGYEPANKNDLPKNIIEDNSGNLSIVDSDGNVIFDVGAEGAKTTSVITNKIELDGVDLERRLDSLSSSGMDNIVDDESGSFIVEDPNGEIILNIDESGLTTTVVTASDVIIDNFSVAEGFDAINDSINEVDNKINTHIDDDSCHVTAEEKLHWNTRSDFSGDYKDLLNAPNIIENEDGTVTYADESGNIIAIIDSSGLVTTSVTAKQLLLNDKDVEIELNNVDTEIANIMNGTTAIPKSTHAKNADNATNASNANSALNAVMAVKDSLGRIISDTYETKTDASTKIEDIQNQLNSKASTEYVDEKVADLVNSAPEALDTLDELASALGDDENFAVTVTNSLAEKATRNDLTAHSSNTFIHVTGAEKNSWNAKSDFSGKFEDLENAPNISDTDDGNLTVEDDDGNIILMADSSGLHSVGLTLNGEAIEDIIENEIKSALIDIEAKLAELMYKPMTINSLAFSNIQATSAGVSNTVKTPIELGSVVTSATLTWECNKTPVLLTLDGEAMNAEINSHTYSNLNLTANKTYKLIATDDKGTSDEKVVTLTFGNRVCYGVAAEPSSIDSDFVMSLSKKELATGKGRTITVNATEGLFVWYCLPARLGQCSFTDTQTGLGAGLSLVATIDVTNASNYTESYYVYKSDYSGLGSLTIKAS